MHTTNERVTDRTLLRKLRAASNERATVTLPSAGDILGSRYRICSVRTVTRTGTQYEAIDEHGDGRSCTVKVVATDEPLVGPELARLVRKMNAARRIEHPRLVPYDDILVQGAWLALVRRSVGGVTLADLIRTEGPQTRDAVVTMVTQTASALSAAHAAGIVHRRLSAASLVRCADGWTVTDAVVEYQLAKTLEHTQGFLSDLSDPAYVPPEESEGRRPSAGSDQYALAKAAIFAFTGATTTDSLPSDVPPEIVAVLARAAAPNPTDRFATIDDFAVALAATVGSLRRHRWRAVGTILAMTVAAVICVVTVSTVFVLAILPSIRR